MLVCVDHSPLCVYTSICVCHPPARVSQIAILMGCAVLPHLRSLVEIIEQGLNDDNQKVNPEPATLTHKP